MISLWVRLGSWLARVHAAALLTVVYYSVLTPVAWLWRLFGADPLDLRAPRDSYWRPVEPHGGSDKAY